ncbi:unnamed protein product [Brassica rapa subsp. trilocularis]
MIYLSIFLIGLLNSLFFIAMSRKDFPSIMKANIIA